MEHPNTIPDLQTQEDFDYNFVKDYIIIILHSGNPPLIQYSHLETTYLTRE